MSDQLTEISPAQIARKIRRKLRETDLDDTRPEAWIAIQALSLAYLALHLSDGLPIITQPFEI